MAQSRRSIWSYHKVQVLVGALLRQRRFQLRRRGNPSKRYLDLGCGENIHEGFLHVDFVWRPHVDVCWDVSRGLPFDRDRFSGAFSEHCLEHFSLADGLKFLAEVHRVLAPGGRLRLIVPDLELYLDGYAARKAGDTAAHLPYETADRVDFAPIYTPAVSVNRIFYVQRDLSWGHRFMYDFATLERVLREVGFREIERRAFGEGGDPKLLRDTPDRRVESLYVEAVKS